MSKQLEWLKYGQTVTETRMKEAEAAKLPAEVMALLWVNHTINAADMVIISKAHGSRTQGKSEIRNQKSEILTGG